MKQGLTIHRKIEDLLTEEIRSMPDGGRIPTEHELCRKYSVSRMTINKIVVRLAEKGLLYRSRGRGTFIVPRMRQQSVVHFLLPCADYLTSSSVSAMITRKIFQGLCEEGGLSRTSLVTVPVSPSNSPHDIRWENLERLKEGDNVIILGYWFLKIFQFLKDRKCNVVYCNSQHSENILKNYSEGWRILTIDYRGMTRDALAYLKGKGRKRPALLCPCYRESAQVHPVLQGYQGAMNAFFPELHDGLVIDYYVREETKEILKKRLSGKYSEIAFDSLIVTDAVFAEDVLNAFGEMGVKIPQELEIITVRDAEMLESMKPSVTAFNVDEIEIGKSAAAVFASGFRAGEDFFRGRLIERESSSPARPKMGCDDNREETGKGVFPEFN